MKKIITAFFLLSSFYAFNQSAPINLGEVQEGEVVINEFMASNDTTVSDQDDEFDDWLELHNTTNAAIDLTGYFLSDNPDNLDKYDIPDGTMIPANGYLIVWADEDGMQAGLHANFRISALGEVLLLLNPDTIIIDEIIFGPQQTDVSFARTPNGTGTFDFSTPTFNANNDGSTTSLNEVDFTTNKLVVFPNPATDVISLTLNTPTIEELDLSIFDVYGDIASKFAPRRNSEFCGFTAKSYYTIFYHEKHL